MKNRNLFKNISYSMFGNMVSLITSFFMVLIIPKFITVDDYGFWQLYIFYLSYFGVLHFGITDGIYLRYLGESYSKLNYIVFKGQAIFLIVIEIIIAVIFMLYAFIVENACYQFIIMGLALSLLMYHINIYNTFVLQLTNRISNFVILLLIEQISFLVIVLFMLGMGKASFYLFIIAKVVSLVLSAICGCWFIRDVWLASVPPLHSIFGEISKNLKVGIQIMLANTASMLIIGVVRYAISLQWDIATFGKISLTLSISNFLIVFTSAISVALLPFLKNIDIDKIQNFYVNSRDVVSYIMLGVVGLYFPFNYIITLWLPMYTDALIYMAILFPVLYFESRVLLLLNNFMKVMRKETILLKVNISVVVFSILFTVLSTIILKNLTLTVCGMLLCFVIRCVVLEIFIDKCLSNKIGKTIVTDILFVTLFVTLGWNFPGMIGFLIYGSFYVVFLIVFKNDIKKSFLFIKSHA